MSGWQRVHPAWIAAGIALLVSIWMASGLIGDDVPADARAKADAAEPEPMRVSVSESVAERIVREAVVTGRTAPVRAVDVKAETAGRVVEIAAERGERVAKGQLILRLAIEDRRERLAQAEAALAQRRVQYRAAERLHAKEYQTEIDLAQAKANLEAAKAEVARIRNEIDHTTIEAPFDGVLEAREPEVGDYLRVGDVAGRVVQQSPFLVVGHVSEDVVTKLDPGDPGTATLVDDREVRGRLRYVASEADNETRTYRVELKVTDGDRRLIAGSSAKLRLPLEEVAAHTVEAAALTIDAEGRLGVKTVDGEDRVHFHRADIVRNEDGTVWLAGLPQRVRVISTGQGFVRDGDRVVPVPEDDGEGDAS